MEPAFPETPLSSKRQRLLLRAALLLLLWALAVAAAYWYFMIKPRQWFDPLMQQPPLLSEPARQAALQQWLQQQYPQLQSGRSWFVRVRQATCSCERYVELYHQSFVRQQAGDMQVVTLDLDEAVIDAPSLAMLRQLIPATPSVVLFNAAAEVVYFGPYHQEGICNAANSYLEPVLQALQQGQDLKVLNTLVFGCFCPTS